MSDTQLVNELNKRRKCAGDGVAINITDLVMSHLTPPTNCTMEVMSQENAYRKIDEFREKQEDDILAKGFSLSESQLIKYKKWNATQNNIIRSQNNGVLKLGASGGQTSFHFAPTGLGLFVEVENCITGNKIDLTEY